MGAIGLVTSYPLTLVAVAVCGVGIATYHPEGARWARHASSSRVTADMSVFSVGGGVGYALGPLVVAATLAPLGLHGTLVIALVPIAAAVLVLVAIQRFRGQPVDERGAAGSSRDARLRVAPVRHPRRAVLPLRRLSRRRDHLPAAVPRPGARGEPGGQQRDDQHPARGRRGRYAARRRGGAALRPPPRAHRATARAGAGHRRAAQPELRRHDPRGGAHRHRDERQHQRRARAGAGVPAVAHGPRHGPHARHLAAPPAGSSSRGSACSATPRGRARCST